MKSTIDPIQVWTSAVIPDAPYVPWNIDQYHAQEMLLGRRRPVEKMEYGQTLSVSQLTLQIQNQLLQRQVFDAQVDLQEAEGRLARLRREHIRLRHEYSVLLEKNETSEPIEIDEFQIDPKLKNVVEDMLESRELLSLDFDWDSEGALPLDEATWRAGIKMTLTLLESLPDSINIGDLSIDISPENDGGNSIHWEYPSRELLIILTPGADEAVYYGDNGQNGKQVKGTISVDGSDTWLACWFG